MSHRDDYETDADRSITEAASILYADLRTEIAMLSHNPPFERMDAEARAVALQQAEYVERLSAALANLRGTVKQ